MVSWASEMGESYCAGLPGCWSQEPAEQEALDNIRKAIREYLTVAEEQLRGEEVREVEITV